MDATPSVATIIFDDIPEEDKVPKKAVNTLFTREYFLRNFLKKSTDFHNLPSNQSFIDVVNTEIKERQVVSDDTPIEFFDLKEFPSDKEFYHNGYI